MSREMQKSAACTTPSQRKGPGETKTYYKKNKKLQQFLFLWTLQGPAARGRTSACVVLVGPHASDLRGTTTMAHC